MITSIPPPQRDYLSYSAIRTFQACPLKYRYRYVDCLPEESVPAALVFGSAVHAAVEHFYVKQLAGEGAPALTTLLDVYQQSWRNRREQTVHFAARDSQESLHDLAARMLGAFVASEVATPQGRIIGVEEELRGSLAPGLPDLLGRVDLILETEDAVVIQDFKTSRSAWTDEQAHEQAEQLLLYASLVRQLVPQQELRLQFVVVTKAKTPTLQTFEVPFAEGRLERVKGVVKTVWSAMQAGHFYPVPTPFQCGGCGYRSRCAAWRGCEQKGDTGGT